MKAEGVSDTFCMRQSFSPYYEILYYAEGGAGAVTVTVTVGHQLLRLTGWSS